MIRNIRQTHTLQEQMPKINLSRPALGQPKPPTRATILPTELHQEEEEDDEEEELFMDCLTQSEANYVQFAEPGGVMGLGIGVARHAGLRDKTGDDRQEFLEPVSELSQNFWATGDDKITAKEVIGGMIEAYGCEAMKAYLETAKPKREREAERKEWEEKWGTTEGQV